MSALADEQCSWCKANSWVPLNVPISLREFAKARANQDADQTVCPRRFPSIANKPTGRTDSAHGKGHSCSVVKTGFCSLPLNIGSLPASMATVGFAMAS